jgi:CheY-like chemotaxis protein
LPGLDGWEVASALRQTGERGPKITMVSANVEDYRAGGQAGCPSHVVPPGIDRHLDELLQLGRIGYVRGIEAKLKEWEAAEPEAATFIAGLRTMVRQFELKKYMEVLGPIRRHE